MKILLFTIPCLFLSQIVMAQNSIHFTEKERTQCHKLYVALKEKNWNYREVDSSLFKLPSQSSHEDDDKKFSNSFVFCGSAKNPGPYTDVAFFSDLYVRKNISYAKGNKWNARPSGFYIVQWKNGVLSLVDIHDVRMLPIKVNGRRSFLVTFPGMASYNRNNPKLPIFGGWGKDGPSQG